MHYEFCSSKVFNTAYRDKEIKPVSTNKGLRENCSRSIIKKKS